MPSLGSVSNTGSFLLGTTAPDAFEPDRQDSFSRHHFLGADARICLQEFLTCTYFIHQPFDDPTWSFTCGYFCHLWLDAYYRDNAERIPFKRLAGVPDSDLKAIVRREAEILNAPFVLDAANLPIPRPEELFFHWF